MRSLLVLSLAVTGCWTSSPSPVLRGSAPAPDPPRDERGGIERDVDQILAYEHGTGGSFTSSELIGWTATRALVYRTALCDDDELGGRGPWCAIEVCEVAANEVTPRCESLHDGAAYDETPAPSRAEMIAAVQRAQHRHAIVTVGVADPPSVVVTDTADADLSVHIPAWFGATRWRLLEAIYDDDISAPLGYSDIVVTDVRHTPDDACIAFAVTGSHLGRYESAMGSIRVGIAGNRCR